jgi:hypothetical protein
MYEKIEAAGGVQHAWDLAGQTDLGSWLVWLQELDTVRKVLNECLLPLLNIVEDLAAKQPTSGLLHNKNIIMIDSLDEAATFSVLRGGGGDTVVTMLLEYRNRWPSWLRFIATSRPLDKDTRSKLQSLSGARIDVKDEHNLKDIECYVTSKLQGNDKESVVKAICDSAKGVFMYASEVVRQYNDDPTIDMNALPTGLAELYMDRYRRTFKEDKQLVSFHEHSKPMLAMLMCSRGPLPLEMVQAAVAGGGVVPRSDAWTVARQQHVEFVQRMCVGSLVEVGFLQFSHKSFPDWLEQNETFRVEKRAGEVLLGAACVKAVSEKDAASAGVRVYSMKHVVAHLVAAGRTQEAKALLLDVGFLMAKSQDGPALVYILSQLGGQIWRDHRSSTGAHSGILIPDLLDWSVHVLKAFHTATGLTH